MRRSSVSVKWTARWIYRSNHVPLKCWKMMLRWFWPTWKAIAVSRSRDDHLLMIKATFGISKVSSSTRWLSEDNIQARSVWDRVDLGLIDMIKKLEGNEFRGTLATFRFLLTQARVERLVWIGKANLKYWVQMLLKESKHIGSTAIPNIWAKNYRWYSVRSR